MVAAAVAVVAVVAAVAVACSPGWYLVVSAVDGGGGAVRQVLSAFESEGAPKYRAHYFEVGAHEVARKVHALLRTAHQVHHQRRDNHHGRARQHLSNRPSERARRGAARRGEARRGDTWR